MTLDIQKSLLTYIYNLLTTDDDLKSAMGGTVRLYAVWAIPDAAFPYLVQRIDIRTDPLSTIRKGTVYIDIWSDSSNANEVLSIRKLILGLLDELEFSTDEVVKARICLVTDGFIPELEPGIWHYATQWDLRFYEEAL